MVRSFPPLFIFNNKLRRHDEICERYSVWEHSESIDWAKMQEMLAENMKKPDTPEGSTVQWFDIDEYTMVQF